MLWLQDISWKLNQSTLGIGYATTSTSGRTIHLLNRPSTTGSFIVLYPYAGMMPSRTMNQHRTANPRLNVLVVSTATDGGLQKAYDIISCLDRITNTTLSTSSNALFYQNIEALQEPEWLGKDENGAGNFVINFQVSYDT
jgi:hypothetical protein